MFYKSHQRTVLVSLFLISFILGAIILTLTVEAPGDGPTRARIAYEWSSSPYWSSYGVWPPGFMYLSGAFGWLVGNPLISTRLLNLIIGSLTVPLFYLLIERIYSSSIALVSAALFVVLPLRLGLSVTSLTEMSFICEIIAGMLLLIFASERKEKQNLYLLFSFTIFLLAEMTRYETWLLIPVFPLYFWAKTKKHLLALLFLIGLLIFPVFWILGNYLYTGDPFAGFSAAAADTAGYLNLIEAIKLLAHKSIPNLGWLIPLMIVGGIIFRLIQLVKIKSINLTELFYLIVTGMSCVVLLKFTMTRGSNLWDRYLFLSLVLVLPFAALPFKAYFQNRWKFLGVFLLVTIASLTTSRIFNKSDIYIVRDRPTDVQEIINWLKKSHYNKDLVLLTKLDWKSTYFPVYFPEKSFDFLIADPFLDKELPSLLEKKPSLLITHKHDYQQKKKIEAILGRKITKDSLVYQVGLIRVYDLKTGEKRN